METQDPLFLSLNEGYNRWSEFYDADDIPLHLLEESVVDEALGNVAGKTVLDLGCGTGRQTLRLAAQGAIVTGVDQSEGMLEKAKVKDTGGAVKFLHLNLDENFPFQDDAFDLVVSFLALEHLSNLGQFFSDCRRVCRNTGFLYFTAMHPAMVLRGVQARFTESSGRKVYPKSHPYQISDYLNSALGAGLQLSKVTEHAPDSSHANSSERALKYEGWPLLLTLKFHPNK
jgi:ubiquinone/menaquinone biosynthesis C-methylase UbiE